LWNLIRITDAGELLEHAGVRFGIKPLAVRCSHTTIG